MNDTLNSLTSTSGEQRLAPESEYLRPLTDAEGMAGLDLHEHEQLEQSLDRKNIGSHLAVGEDGRLRIQAHAQTPPVARTIINEFNNRGGLTEDSYREFYFGLVQYYCQERQHGTKQDVAKLLNSSLPYEHMARFMYPSLSDEEASVKIADLNDQMLNLGYDLFHPQGKLRDVSNMVDDLHPTGTPSSQAGIVDEILQASGVIDEHARSGFNEEYFTHEGTYKRAGLDEDGKEMNPEALELYQNLQSNPRMLNDYLAARPEAKELIKDGEITDPKKFMLGEEDNTHDGFVGWYLNPKNELSPHKKILALEVAAIKHYNKALIASELYKMRAESGEVDSAAEYAMVRRMCDETKYSGYRSKLQQYSWLSSQAEQELWESCAETSLRLNERAQGSHESAQRLNEAAETAVQSEKDEKERAKATEERIKTVLQNAHSTHIVGVKSGSKDTCALIRVPAHFYDELCLAHGKDPGKARVVVTFSGSSSRRIALPVKRSEQIQQQHSWEPEFYLNESAERVAYGPKLKSKDRRKTRNIKIDFHVE